MPYKNWSLALRQVIHNAREMEAHATTAQHREQLGTLVRDLERLDLDYEAEQQRVVLETRRRLADLDGLHNANRLVTLGTLTMGMAHELGTPLGVVSARAQMIVSDENDLAEARKDAEEIIRQVTRMTQMCREVLDYVRPTVPTKVPVDVVQIVRQTIALLSPDARKRRAKLVLEHAPVPTLVLGDSSKLVQVLTNLTINAAQAMPNGGTVTVAIDKARVQPPTVEELPEAEYVRVHVRDTGTGIRSADLVHIFETFFTTKKSGEGTGLGLAVSYRIAREHNGWIGVVTEEGRGSTFTVYLPLLESSER